MATITPSFQSLGYQTDQGDPITEARGWTLIQGWFNTSMDFRCGECQHMHRKHKSLGGLRTDGMTQDPLLVAFCDCCAALNVFRLPNRRYLSING